MEGVTTIALIPMVAIYYCFCMSSGKPNDVTIINGAILLIPISL